MIQDIMLNEKHKAMHVFYQNHFELLLRSLETLPIFCTKMTLLTM